MKDGKSWKGNLYAKRCTRLTIWNGNEVEDQEPDPSLPSNIGVGDGNWTSVNGQEGSDPLAGDTEREANMAISEWHNLSGIHVLREMSAHSILHESEMEDCAGGIRSQDPM